MNYVHRVLVTLQSSGLTQRTLCARRHDQGPARRKSENPVDAIINSTGKNELHLGLRGSRDTACSSPKLRERLARGIAV